MNRRTMLAMLLGTAAFTGACAATSFTFAQEQLPSLAPSGKWNGTAGSGFRKPPIDPQRLTAKPMIRLLTPPNQAFTDRLTIGVRAMANNKGSLYENEGLAKVRVHYEGATLDIERPSIRPFEDANGNEVQYLGWWADIEQRGIIGEGHVYFEAIPLDTSMQSRIIGPYTYLTLTEEHDYELEVAATPAAIAGKRYKTLTDALNYLHARKDVQNPKITFTEGGVIDPGAIFYINDIPGWCTVEATVPVTFAKPAFTDDVSAMFRLKYGNFRFRGANITLDFANAITFYTEYGHRVWIDGANIINSAGRDQFYRKGPPNANSLFREKPYFTEAAISHVKNPCSNASLVRGGTLTRVVNDPFQDAAAVIGTFTDGCDVDHLAIDRPALTARYRGNGNSATLEGSSPADSASRVFTAKVDGRVVGTFTVYNSQAAATANTNYTVQNVADWLNGLAGWSAAVRDNGYRATAMSIADNRGAAFGPTDVKSKAVTLKTHFDLHSDLFGQNIGGLGENIIIAENTAINLTAQSVFYAARSPGLNDAAFVNNAFENDENGFLASQFGSPLHSHIVIAHNSWMGQQLLLRGDQGWTGGAYSLIAANVVKRIRWVGPADPETPIIGNLTYGDDEDGLLMAAQSGDFAPAAQLRRKTGTSFIRYDAALEQRDAASPAGAYI